MKEKKEAPTKKTVTLFIEELIEQQQYTAALDLVRRFKVKGYTVAKTSLKNYPLTTKQKVHLDFIEVKNPYYSTSASMKLYLIAQIQDMVAKTT